MQRHIIAGVAASCLLSGCFDLNQTLSIRPDNTATYEFEIVLDASLVGLLTEEDSSGETSNPCESSDMSFSDGLEVPEEVTVEADNYYDSGNLICSFTIDGPFEKFSEVTLDLGSDDVSGQLIEIEKTGDYSFRLTSDMTYESDETESSDESELGTTLLAAMSQGRALRWDVAAPRILSSNGRVNDANTEVSWELPLSAWLSGQKNEFVIEIELDKPWWAKAMDVLN